MTAMRNLIKKQISKVLIYDFIFDNCFNQPTDEYFKTCARSVCCEILVRNIFSIAELKRLIQEYKTMELMYQNFRDGSAAQERLSQHNSIAAIRDIIEYLKREFSLPSEDDKNE